MITLRVAAGRLLAAVDNALPYAPHRREFDVVADTADDLRKTLVQFKPLTIEESLDLMDKWPTGTFAGVEPGDAMRIWLAASEATERAHGIFKGGRP